MSNTPSKLTDTLIEIIKGVKDKLEDQLSRRSAETYSVMSLLEARIGALEARPAGGVKWAGTFAHGKNYHEGQLVTDRGALWLALRDTAARPGSDPSWRLVVKRGADI